MATKTAVEIKITGEVQGQTILDCYAKKNAVKEAENEYNAARENATPIIKSKIYAYWKKVGQPIYGMYRLLLPHGAAIAVTIQNQQSRKTFSPEEAKKLINDLGVKGGDVFDTVKTTVINQKLMSRPKIAAAIMSTLDTLQSQLRANGDLTAEETLTVTTTDLKLAEHAIPRLLAISEGKDPDKRLNASFEDAITQLKDPVTCLINQ